MKKILIVAAPLILSACGGPVELTVAKLAGDFISYVSTGKSTTDHMVSAMADEDCALHRPLFDEDVCRADALPGVALALDTSGLVSIDQEIASAQPAIYAVNAPKEDWSDPRDPAVKPQGRSVVVIADLPPVPEPKHKPVEVASLDPVPDARKNDALEYEDDGLALKPQIEADVAVAGYIETPVLAPETGAAAAPENAVPGLYVVLASFRDQDRAHKALDLYREYQPRLIPASVQGAQFVRVAVGPLSRPHANDLRLLAAKKGVKDVWVVGLEAVGE
ncbi:SPOR domain-containing protein [Thalassospira sp.]|uniref:SPOR domain-containing protein n=1 Tax=Thalassospira sp. TaxID=1912094 RepID=UPI002736B0CD|nr:SPOR domain-containing protein [Thalassospira sp.]MDP2696847.1 SPOR domain-containing protein [Thalassospira sp.]